MKYTTLFLLTLFSGLSHASNLTFQINNFQRVIGGTAAGSTQWPWATGLIDLESEETFCAASLISESWILTAAHCVERENTASFEVSINRPVLSSTQGERHAISQIILHPDYDRRSFDNDIALVQLSTRSSIKPIRLISEFERLDSKVSSGIALGWGSLSADEEIYPNRLQQVELPIIADEECRTLMNGITDNMFCAGILTEAKDTCIGDSGGPLIIFDRQTNEWIQTGITSWGLGCALSDSYGVYTRLKNYSDFISEHICIQSLTPPTLEISLTDQTVTANWQLNSTETNQYRLLYAPFPEASPIISLEMENATEFSSVLPAGSSFYVAIRSFQDNCQSPYSNIESFDIN